MALGMTRQTSNDPYLDEDGNAIDFVGLGMNTSFENATGKTAAILMQFSAIHKEYKPDINYIGALSVLCLEN